MHRFFIIVLFYCIPIFCYSQLNNFPGKAIDLANFDLSIKPGDDFYKYVNGGWLKNNPIPAGNSSWGTFTILRQRNAEIMKAIIQESVSDKSGSATPEPQLIKDFYIAGMDSVAIEKIGSKALSPLFAKIDAIKNTNDLATVMGWLQLNFCNAGFRFYKNWDPKNSNQIIATIDQYGGFALPDREYYLKDDKAAKEIREKYQAHVRAMMKHADIPQSQLKPYSDAVLKIETILSINCMTEEEFRNPALTYHKMKLSGLIKKAPSFSWRNYFMAMGLKDDFEINVIPPDFFTAFGNAVKKNPLNQWKAYLKWCVVNNAAPYLNTAFVNENFNFFQKELNGVSELKPRWQRVLEQEESNLGWALGKEYVKRYFSPKAKEIMLGMIEDIKAAFRTRIQKLDWMSEPTKQKAIEKLNKIYVKVGYPDKWRDITGIKITPDNYLLNIMSCSRFFAGEQVKEVGKPANKYEWGMTPQEVNAYYNSLQNEIVFPSGILQAPFFDENFDAAVNYGAIGCVIAHEFTHAFDDQGSQYDADGNLNNWWTAEDLKQFKEKQKLIIAQYNQYKILDTLRLNGELTVGENIADLGGVSIAYEAFQMHQQKYGRQKDIDGFTAEQRFFIAWTQIWRQNKTPEALAVQVNTSTTSPYMVRGFASLSNLESFKEAFNLREDDKMITPLARTFSIW